MRKSDLRIVRGNRAKLHRVSRRPHAITASSGCSRGCCGCALAKPSRRNPSIILTRADYSNYIAELENRERREIEGLREAIKRTKQ